jgi:hypothetical protein
MLEDYNVRGNRKGGKSLEIVRQWRPPSFRACNMLWGQQHWLAETFQSNFQLLLPPSFSPTQEKGCCTGNQEAML